MADHNPDSNPHPPDHHHHEKEAEDLKEEDFLEEDQKMHEDLQIDAQSEISANLEEERNRVSIEELEESIIRYCKENKCLYEDESFPAGPPSLYNNPDNIPDYDKNMGCEQWVRPKDISDSPVLFANGVSPGDVQQGLLGDCWFLGSICSLAINPSLLERLFVNVEHMNEYGFITCQFFKNGNWQQVLIDTRIPYNSSYGSPIYGHCKDSNEMWLPLIEKAYAKLHKTYENLNGGKMTDAMVDLTGEASEKYNLRDPKVASMIENGELWSMMIRFFRQGSLLGCSNSLKGQDGEQTDEVGGDGIWNNHAYGIMDIRDIKGLKLIRIRNPWGEGEWKGTFGDEDEEWDKHRGLKDELNYEFGKDGTWWMSFEDWVKHYNRLFIGRIFPEKWHKFSIDGKWEGKTAGGPPPMTIDRDEEVAEHIKMDSDDKWFNNPQYRLTIKKKTHLFISLMQSDQKLSGLSYLPCNFLLIKTTDKKNRIWEKDKDDVIVSASEGLQRVGQREISKDIVLELPENKKEAHFIIVPNLEVEGKKLESETSKKGKGRQFWLRLFAQNPVQVLELAETFEVIERGEWISATAGGKRVLRNGKDNPLWCRNPQYFLNVSAVTLLKIILRKTGKARQAKGFTVGMVVCQAPIKHSNKKNPAVTTKKSKTMAQISEKDPETFEKERKLQILMNEWFVESHYQYEEFSCLYLKLEQNHGPFLIVPSLSQEGILSSYTLTIYSNNPVVLDRLSDSKNIVTSGEWNKSTAGGSHLFDSSFIRQTEKSTWGNNPKYLLKFNGQAEVRAKITLSRPERLWSGKIARNTVGCMMGIYIFDAVNSKPTVGSWVRKPEFMPLNEIEEILEEDSARENGYIIMPTTYESNMRGPFALSISSENDFTLTGPLEASQ
jgi:Calpain family cysteine protease/Calpain large subunit, domain III